MFKISIIIPVYNVEKYIAKCIQSLLDQTYTNFEAIIVDDESPDNSIQIAKSLVGDDPRFIFLEKENGGQSSARNMGIDYAKGDYLAFLDPDDYFANETLELNINIFKNYPEVDITLFGTLWITEAGDVVRETHSDIDLYYTCNDILLFQNSIEHMIWNKCYKREVFDGMRFIEGVIYEDTEIMPKLLFQKKLYKIEKYLYFYTQRVNSSINSYSSMRIRSNFIYLESYKKFLIFNGLYGKYKNYYELGYIHRTFVDELGRLVQFSLNYDHDLAYFKKRIDLNLISFKNILLTYSILSKPFILVFLFRIHPKLILLLYQLKKLLG